MPKSPTIASLRAEFAGDPRDADHLLAHALGQDVAWLLAHGDSPLTNEQIEIIRALFARRQSHEPLAYILGHQPFYGRGFSVTPDVLIPRPESELIIDQVKQDLRDVQNPIIVDVGTGSGILAITAALEMPQARVIGVDVSTKALAVAKRNADALQANQVGLLQGNLLEPLIHTSQPVHAIMANLPYLPEEEITASPTSQELAHEPRLALVAQDHGLALIKDCVHQANQLLACGGMLYLEMLPDQIPAFSIWLLLQGLPFTSTIVQDLSGQNRIVCLRKTC